MDCSHRLRFLYLTFDCQISGYGQIEGLERTNRADARCYRLGAWDQPHLPERDSIKDRLDLEKREHARELQAKQAEIDRLSEEVARLRHDLDFTQSVCRQMMKQNNLQEDTLSDGENM